MAKSAMGMNRTTKIRRVGFEEEKRMVAVVNEGRALAVVEYLVDDSPLCLPRHHVLFAVSAGQKHEPVVGNLTHPPAPFLGHRCEQRRDLVVAAISKAG